MPKPAAKSFPAVERRGPQRSKNVTRIAAARPAATPGATPKAEPPVLTTQAETRKAPAGGGGDDDWTSF
jgi:hypothetical protein